MYAIKSFSLKRVVTYSGWHMLWLLLWAALVTILYEVSNWQWFFIPWLPLSVIGTAVAFYVGFKNNQSYNRLWEARKIWGAIVNSSRSWGASVRAFVNDHERDGNSSRQELLKEWQPLIYRHIAWLYALRSQLLVATPWEHSRKRFQIGEVVLEREKIFGHSLVEDEITRDQLKSLLPADEYDRLVGYQNTATQIIDQQAQELTRLKSEGFLNNYNHVELQRILGEFYVHQGKCERIKKFPLPRQYASMSMIFVGIFIFLLPFGMVAEFHDMLEGWGAWLGIPITALVGWVYLMMELVGSYSENPFEGLGNDIPMYALCRTIEIDLRQMLDETELPPAVSAKNGILM